eukprot:TRINITY_DN60234_c0_g1_i1.p1 TRINITY_DN60234_c0_g1~~TRINITY_DN60234_c0_g1_i1.p1  ORF type:complete len:475 (-),score=67.68 TRINITY_DN60234_c0_g1_i1:263-1687(-)
MTDSSVTWLICDECGQSHSVEGDRAAKVQEIEPWTCSMNDWNPGMAYCWPKKQFDADYLAWGKKDNPHFRIPSLGSKQVDVWWLYNFVTQMGGWVTVKEHGLLPMIYGWNEDWARMKDIDNRLIHLYEEHLLKFEEEHFKGKKYRSKEELNKLYTTSSTTTNGVREDPQTSATTPASSSATANTTLPASPAPPPTSPTPNAAGAGRPRKKRKTTAVGFGEPPVSTYSKVYTLKGPKVWVLIPGAPWWPAQVLQKDEIKYVPDELKEQFLQSKENTLLRLYGVHEFYYCDCTNVEVIVPWDFRHPLKGPMNAQSRAIAAAQKGAQTARLTKDEKGHDKMAANKGRRPCAQVVPGTFEGQPSYNNVDEEEEVLQQLEKDLERRLAELQQKQKQEPTAATTTTTTNNEKVANGDQTVNEEESDEEDEEEEEMQEDSAPTPQPAAPSPAQTTAKPPGRPRCVSVSTAGLARSTPQSGS